MENTSPPTIQLDVFGFSRGAAMARHFVNCIKQNYFDFKDPDINEAFSANNILINFLGVFDTVGSFNIAGDNDDFGFSFRKVRACNMLLLTQKNFATGARHFC